MIGEAEARRAIIEVGRRLYEKDIIAAGDGNISMRIDVGSILVTASGVHKGFLQPDDIIEVDVQGYPRGPEKEGAPRRHPSSEWRMHELCYRERPDCAAVVHAHPPTAVALALAGVSLEDGYLSEACLTLGPVPVAPYVLPTTPEVAEALRPFVRRSQAVLMNHHGALCLGRTLDEAWRRMETLEHTAKVIHRARAFGPVPTLTADQVSRLDALAQKLGTR